MCAALTSAHGATLQRTLTIAAGAEGRVMAAGHAKAGRAKLNALCLRLLQGHHVRDAASIEVQEGVLVLRPSNRRAAARGLIRRAAGTTNT